MKSEKNIWLKKKKSNQIKQDKKANSILNKKWENKNF